jgi:hypothetical protein
MKKFICIGKNFLILALVFAGVVGAQDRWELLATNSEGSSFYIDTGSIIILSPYRYLVWEKFYPVGRDRKETLEGALKGIKDAEKYEFTMRRIEIDCASMRCRTHSFFLYTWEGKILFEGSDKLSEWDDFPPGSIGWSKMERVCTKRYDGKEM